MSSPPSPKRVWRVARGSPHSSPILWMFISRRTTWALGPMPGRASIAEVAEVGLLLALADLEEAGRLGPARRQLGQDLVRRRPDRDRDPDLALDPPLQLAGRLRERGIEVAAAGELQVGLVERGLLDVGRAVRRTRKKRSEKAW